MAPILSLTTCRNNIYFIAMFQRRNSRLLLVTETARHGGVCGAQVRCVGIPSSQVILWYCKKPEGKKTLFVPSFPNSSTWWRGIMVGLAAWWLISALIGSQGGCGSSSWLFQNRKIVGKCIFFLGRNCFLPAMCVLCENLPAYLGIQSSLSSIFPPAVFKKKSW